MLQFNTGILAVVPSGANPTPQQIALLDDVSLDLEQAIKYAQGGYKFAFDAASGPNKIKGSAKFKSFGSLTLAAVLSGSTTSAGMKVGIVNEQWTIPATPFQVTVAGGANFYENLGVLNQTTGKPMTVVASAPATGQYSYVPATGVYTFAAADTGTPVTISYSQTAAAVGITTAIPNGQMGQATFYNLDLFNTYSSGASMKRYGCRLPYCVFPKLGLAFKSEDFAQTSLEFEAIGYNGQSPGNFYSEE